MNNGKTAIHAVQGGLMHFLPGMEGVSMEKPFVDCMRDVWAMFEGPAMLNLNYANLLAAVGRLKRSAYARMQEATGKYEIQAISNNFQFFKSKTKETVPCLQKLLYVNSLTS